MSRMSKYLKQTVLIERVKLDTSGKPTMNAYGELEYEAAKQIPCRRERYIKDVTMPNGAVVQSSTQYYTVVEIGMNDKLDGNVVLMLEEYTNEAGQPEGFRSVT